MKIDRGRLARQKEGLRKWRENGYTGTLRWATGVGKTFAGILGIKHLKDKNPDLFTIVAVPSDPLRTQWKQRLIEHNVDRVYVETVHSLVGKQHECDLFVLDEIHSYTGGPVFSTLFDCVNRSYTLGLTAREREKPEDQEVLNANASIVDIITLLEALRNGWISEFRVYNLGLTLLPEDRIRYNKLHQEFNKYFSTFDFNFDKAIACLGNRDLRNQVAREMHMPVKTVDAHTFQFNRVMQARKKYLYNSVAVFNAAVSIINKFDNRKIITFSETTEMVDRLTEAIEDSAAYHSSLKTILIDGKKFGKKRLKKLAIDKFTNGEVRVLNTAKALNAGTDIPTVDMSIKTSFNSTVLDSIQRLGRTLRKYGDKQAVEVNLCILNSQSEKWLRKSQKETPNVEWITSIDQINA